MGGGEGWPVLLDGPPSGAPAVGDVDGDGLVEIAALSYDSIYLLETDGTYVAGWPQHLATWSWCPPTVADLDGDGVPEVLCGENGSSSSPSEALWAWSASGVPLPGFPFVSPVAGGCEGPITVADTDNDGSMEIFADSNAVGGTDGFLYGIDATGKPLPGFPLRPLGYTLGNGATIGDVAGDGDYELGVVSSHASGVNVNLYDLPGTYHPSDIPWETYHQRGRRGGLLGGEDRLHVAGLFAAGGPVRFVLHDRPGHKAFLFAAKHTARKRIAGMGWLYLPKSEMKKLIFNATIDGTGEYVLERTLPANPALVGRTFYLQGVTGADPLAGVGRLTNLLGRTVQ